MKEKNYSRSIANTIDNFLTEDDWHFSFDDRLGLFRFGLSSKGMIKKLSYIVDVKEDEYLVYVVSSVGADATDEKMMASMAEFVCRANYGLKNGNFELDMRDGEIRYKSYVDCAGITPTWEMVKRSIYCPAAMLRRYSEGILDVIFGNLTAKEAVAKCEVTPEEERRARPVDTLDDPGDAPDEGGDSEAMIARIAARLGGAGSSPGTDSGQPEPAGGVKIVKTGLFRAKGGVA